MDIGSVQVEVITLIAVIAVLGKLALNDIIARVKG